MEEDHTADVERTFTTKILAELFEKSLPAIQSMSKPRALDTMSIVTFVAIAIVKWAAEADIMQRMKTVLDPMTSATLPKMGLMHKVAKAAPDMT